MKKIGVLIVIAIFTLVGVSAAIALTSTNNSSDQTKNAVNDAADLSNDESGNTTVKITGFEYVQKSITVKSGTTVTWVNEDSTQHDVTPDEPGSFDGSKLLGKGDSYSYTFNEPGTYDYHCSPHPHMTATVIVQ